MIRRLIAPLAVMAALACPAFAYNEPVTPDQLVPGAAAANLGFTPVNPANNGSEFTPSLFRANLGLGALATISSVDLGTSAVTGLLPAAKLASGAAVVNLGFVPLNPANNGSDFASPSTTLINLSAIPHVANTTAVKSYPRATGAMVLRDGFAAPGDAGEPILYYWSSSGCTLNGNTGDNGYEIKPSATGATGCWTSAFPTSGADIRNWGVVASTSPGSDATGANTAAFVAAAKAASLRNAGGGTIIVPPYSFELGQIGDIDLTPWPGIRIVGSAGGSIVGYNAANWYAENTIRMNGGNDPALPQWTFRVGANTEITGIRLVNSALPYDVPSTSRQGFDIVKHFSGTGFTVNRSDVNIHDVQINGFTMAMFPSEIVGTGAQQLQRFKADNVDTDAMQAFDINGCGDRCETTRIESGGYLTPFQGTHPLSGVTYDIASIADSGAGYAVTGGIINGANTITLSSAGPFAGPNIITLPGGATAITLGQAVAGTGIPANTTITAVDTVNLILTMSANATATNASASLTFGAHEVTVTSGAQSTPFVVGDVVGLYGIGPRGSGQPIGRYTIDSLGPGATDFTLAASTYVAPMTGPVTPTGTVIDGGLNITGLSSTTGIFPGQHIAGFGVPDSTQVASVGATSLTMTSKANIPNYNITGSITNGSTSVTGLSTTANLYAGMVVTATGVPSGATVVSINTGASSLVLSAAATATNASAALNIGNGSISTTLTLNGRVNIPMQRRIGGPVFAWHGHGTQGGEYAASLWEYGHDICINFGPQHGPMDVFYPWCDGYDTDGSSADATPIGVLHQGIGGSVHGGTMTDKPRQFVINTTDGLLYGGDDRVFSIVNTAVGVGAGCSGAQINPTAVGGGNPGAFATLISGSMAVVNATVRGYTSCQQPTVANGTLTNASTSVTGLPNTANFYVGMPVFGTFVPVGATVASIASPTAITLSAPATGADSQSLTFGTLYNGVYIAPGAGSFFATNYNSTRTDDQIGIAFDTPADCLTSMLNGSAACNVTKPTVTAGFGLPASGGTPPTITLGQGALGFQITIGSSGTMSTGTLAMPYSPTKWSCGFTNETNPATSVPSKSGAGTQISVPVTNYNRSGTPTNWTPGDVITAQCSPI